MIPRKITVSLNTNQVRAHYRNIIHYEGLFSFMFNFEAYDKGISESLIRANQPIQQSILTVSR